MRKGRSLAAGKRVSCTALEKTILGMQGDISDMFEDEASAPRPKFHVMEFQKARGAAQISYKQFNDMCRMSWTDPSISNLMEQLLLLYKLKGGIETSSSWNDPEKPNHE